MGFNYLDIYNMMVNYKKMITQPGNTIVTDDVIDQIDNQLYQISFMQSSLFKGIMDHLGILDGTRSQKLAEFAGVQLNEPLNPHYFYDRDLLAEGNLSEPYDYQTLIDTIDNVQLDLYYNGDMFELR